MRNFLLFSALCLGVSAVGRADTTFYLVNNTYDDGTGNVGSATGTVNIDTVNNLFDSANIAFTLNGSGSPLLFTGTQSPGTLDGTQDFYTTNDSAGDFLLIDLPVNTLAGYAGGSLCAIANPCTDSLGDQVTGAFYSADFTVQLNADAGSLVTTPEPSSVVLLGTGLLATVGAMRRRMFSRGA